MKVNSGQAPSTLIPEYIGSDFDKVVAIVDIIESVTEVADNLTHIKTVDGNLENIVTVADNITDVGNVSTNIGYVRNVAAGIEGLPVQGYIGETPPTQPKAGAEWYCTLDGRTYVWYVDTDSGQWVESSPQSQITTFEQTTTVALTSKTTSINTVGKYTGKPVFNVDTKRYVYAIASSPTAVWNNFDGTVAHTPV